MFKTWKSVVKKPLKILDYLITLILLGVTLFLILYWKHIPEQVPQHWDLYGRIDDYSDAGSYLFLVIMMYFFYAWHMLSKILPSFDLRDNLFGKELAHKVTEEIANKYYNLLFAMLWICDLILQATFAYIIICGVLLRNLGVWFLPGVFILLTADFVWFFVMIGKLRKECLKN